MKLHGHPRALPKNLRKSLPTLTRPSLARRMRSILRKKLAQQVSVLSNNHFRGNLSETLHA